MNPRTDENQAAYEEFKRSYRGVCAFCDVGERNPAQILETNDSMMVLQNDYPYATWDLFDVGDHRMIVPKRHIGTLESFSDAERHDYFDLIARYEASHYSVYSRAPSNPTRTALHLHTHLIRPVGF